MDAGAQSKARDVTEAMHNLPVTNQSELEFHLNDDHEAMLRLARESGASLEIMEVYGALASEWRSVISNSVFVGSVQKHKSTIIPD